jgi:hypothetical protein
MSFESSKRETVLTSRDEDPETSLTVYMIRTYFLVSALCFPCRAARVFTNTQKLAKKVFLSERGALSG